MNFGFTHFIALLISAAVCTVPVRTSVSSAHTFRNFSISSTALLDSKRSAAAVEASEADTYSDISSGASRAVQSAGSSSEYASGAVPSPQPSQTSEAGDGSSGAGEMSDDLYCRTIFLN